MFGTVETNTSVTIPDAVMAGVSNINFVFSDETPITCSPFKFEMNEKDIFLKFAHSHVERDELERSNNNNNNEFRIGSLPIGHFKRLPAKPPN